MTDLDGVLKFSLGVDQLSFKWMGKTFSWIKV